jgi:methylated-DNA-protein-cysteine methyltransferase-like protein
MKYTNPENRAAFNQAVWQIVRQIPAGRVATYGQIARLITPPGGMSQADYLTWGARWVGGAMAACPDDVPWWRVINSQGKISLRPGEGKLRQHELLEDEGVIFDERERVNMKRYSWAGPGDTGIYQTGFNLDTPAKGDS